MSKAILGVATDNGTAVLKPGDEGTDYTMVSRGLVGRSCGCIARTGDGQIAVGTDDFFVQLSKDGLEWKASLEGIQRPHITALARHPKHSHLLFAGSSPPAVYMSTDQGKTWQSMAPLESLESAQRWTYPKPPYRARVTGIACHAEHAGVVLCSIDTGGLAASKDGGKTWVSRDQGLPPAVRCLVIPPGGGNRVYAGTQTGFYRSDDLAGSWQEHNHGLPFTQVLALTVAGSNPDVIVMSVAGRGDTGTSTLVLSKDGGKSWTPAVEGLPSLENRRVVALTFGKGGFYAGTNQGDLFFLNNMEGRWTRLGSASLGAIRDLIALAG